jgi:signal transduction histidine kinase
MMGGVASAAMDVKRIIAEVFREPAGKWPTVVAGILAGIVFLLEWIFSSGITTQMLYVAPVLVSLWSQRHHHTLVIANVSTALTVLGLFVASPPTDRLGVEVANRLLAIYAIWAVAIIFLLRRRGEEAVAEERDSLLRTVQSRTSELASRTDEFRKELSDRRRAEESLRKLSGYLLQLQDDERRRIARELHDTTAQGLAAIAVNLARVEKLSPKLDPKSYDVLADTIAMAEQCSQEIRTLSYLLHPPLLEEAGLVSAVKWFADGFSERTGIRVELELPASMERLTTEVETTLFRIVQESLTNISRHSGSKTARIRMVRAPGEIVLEVKDEGCGIPPEKLAKVNGNVAGLGVGIAGIWERIRQFEGELEVNSNSRGTSLTVVLPIHSEVQV